MFAVKRMRRPIVLAAVAFVFCFAAGAVWIFYAWFWPSIHYQRVHHAIFETTSEARLQLLARQVVTIAHTLGPTNGLWFLRDRRDAPIPADFKDLDPTDITIYSDQATVELCGGFDHYGFVIRRSDEDSDVWLIVRYDELHKTPVGEYRHSEAATGAVVPKGAPVIREP